MEKVRAQIAAAKRPTQLRNVRSKRTGLDARHRRQVAAAPAAKVGHFAVRARICESPDRTKDTAQHLQLRDVAGLGRTQQALVQNDDQVRMDGGVRLRRREDSLPATTLLRTESAAFTTQTVPCSLLYP